MLLCDCNPGISARSVLVRMGCKLETTAEISDVYAKRKMLSAVLSELWHTNAVVHAHDLLLLSRPGQS